MRLPQAARPVRIRNERVSGQDVSHPVARRGPGPGRRRAGPGAGAEGDHCCGVAAPAFAPSRVWEARIASTRFSAARARSELG